MVKRKITRKIKEKPQFIPARILRSDKKKLT